MAKEAPLLPTTEPQSPPAGKKQSATEKREALVDRLVRNRLPIFFTVCALATAIIPPSCAFFSWASSIPEPYFDATLWTVHGFLISQLPMATWNIASLLSTEDKMAIFSTRYTLPSAIARISLVALSMSSFLQWYALLSHSPLHHKLHDASVLAWCFLGVVFLPRGRWLTVVFKALFHVTLVVFFISVFLKIKYENPCRSIVVKAAHVSPE